MSGWLIVATCMCSKHYMTEMSFSICLIKSVFSCMRCLEYNGVDGVCVLYIHEIILSEYICGDLNSLKCMVI